jgi:phosphoribosyl-ATP pyrophosphohydrolase/phosphoribosyl-AMP cyclohydrolase
MVMKMQLKTFDVGVLRKIKFSPDLHRDGTRAPNLIGIILQNYQTKEVLYGASMSREALEETIQKELVVLYSKSRKCRWLKGETSGDMLAVKKIALNCNNDQLLVQVIPLGQGICHEKDESGQAKETCFSKTLLELI